MNETASLSAATEAPADQRYNRQLHLLGEEGVRSLASSDVLIVGASEVSMALALNLALAGVRRLVIWSQSDARTGSLAALALNPDTAVVALRDVDPANYLRTAEAENVRAAILSAVQDGDLVRRIDRDARKRGIPVILAEAVDRCSDGTTSHRGRILADYEGLAFALPETDQDGPFARTWDIAMVSGDGHDLRIAIDAENHDLVAGDVLAISGGDSGATARSQVLAEVLEARHGDPQLVLRFAEQAHVAQARLFDFARATRVRRAPIQSSGYAALGRRAPGSDGTPGPVVEGLGLASELSRSALETIARTPAGASPLSESASSPLQISLTALVGAFAAHEVLKGILRRGVPCPGAYVFDIGGSGARTSLAASRILVIGCGAVGCEVLRCLAEAGACTEGDGLLMITDPDVIERSNLNRQSLFRDADVGQPKAVVGTRAVRARCPEMRVEARLDAVNEQTRRAFPESLFARQTLVIAAVDNVATRVYVDQRCIESRTPLIDTGTLGARGHVQAIFPGITETYQEVVDPATEHAIPLCTVKSFPESAEHAIAWARDRYVTAFQVVPQELLSYAGGICAPKRLVRAIRAAGDRPRSIADCRSLAIRWAVKWFDHRIRNVLHNLPPDARDRNGQPFWRAPRRCPGAIRVRREDEDVWQFVQATTRMLERVYAVERDGVSSAETTPWVAPGENDLPFSPKSKHIAMTDQEAREIADRAEANDASPQDRRQLDDRLSEVRDSLAAGPAIRSIAFDKDDPEAIAFVAAAARLRARNYHIDPPPHLEVQRLAGAIVPAIATSTAAVAAIALREAALIADMRSGRGDPRGRHLRNHFFNLDIGLYVATEPGRAKMQHVGAHSFTVWDRWEVHAERDLRLSELIAQIQMRSQMEVAAVLYRVTPLYLKSMPTHRTRADKHVTMLLPNLEHGVRYVDLVVLLGERLQPAPRVRYVWGGGGASRGVVAMFQ